MVMEDLKWPYSGSESQFNLGTKGGKLYTLFDLNQLLASLDWPHELIISPLDYLRLTQLVAPGNFLYDRSGFRHCGTIIRLAKPRPITVDISNRNIIAEVEGNEA